MTDQPKTPTAPTTVHSVSKEDPDIRISKQGDIEIVIHRPKCISAATCVVYAENTFDLDEENLAIVKNGAWDRLEKIIAAAQSCPVLAIEVYEKGKKLYPLDP